MRLWITLALVAALALPSFAFGMGGGMMGQAVPEDMWSGVEFTPVVGQWSEYLMTMENEEPVAIHVSIVGQEGDAYWYEMYMAGEDNEELTTKMLVTGDPGEEENLKRLIIKNGDEPAMEMPVGDNAMDPMFGGIPGMGGEEVEEVELEEPDVTPIDLGVETVTVPAGTFEARHFRIEDEDVQFDIWQSTAVGPYGTIKMTSGEYGMELMGHGDDAESRITEEPEKFEMPQFNIPGFGG